MPIRLAHHLRRHPSGTFHFRLVVPADLRATFGKKIVKISLRTKDPAAARAYAYELGAQYARSIAEARGGQGAQMSNSYDDCLKSLKHLEIVPQPDGTHAVRTDGSEQDNAAALKALKMLTRPRLPAGIYDTRSPYERLIATHPVPEVPKAPTLMEAFETYVDMDARNLKADTWQQRERSLRALIAHVGGEVRVDRVGVLIRVARNRASVQSLVSAASPMAVASRFSSAIASRLASADSLIIFPPARSDEKPGVVANVVF
jgi:hypothetical protein